MAGSSEVPIPSRSGEHSIGVCYGMCGTTFPKASDVVSLYKSKNIGAMRLYEVYEPNLDMLNALKDTGIKVMMGVPNGLLKLLADPTSTVAADWVRDNITPYADKVSFKYIVVGNEIAQEEAQYILPALKNMWKEIANAGFEGRIKVSTAVKYDVFTDPYYPSKTKFNCTYMDPIVKFLDDTQNPFLVNIYPYFYYKQNQNKITIDYALFKSPGPVVDDNGCNYQNLFTAMVDAAYKAVENAGGLHVEVVVSESGWPTADGFAASVENAQTYNQNLIDHVAKGTPKKPGLYLETYICSIFNEDERDGLPADKKFGFCNTDDGSAIYPLNFKKGNNLV